MNRYFIDPEPGPGPPQANPPPSPAWTGFLKGVKYLADHPFLIAALFSALYLALNGQRAEAVAALLAALSGGIRPTAKPPTPGGA